MYWFVNQKVIAKNQPDRTRQWLYRTTPVEMNNFRSIISGVRIKELILSCERRTGHKISASSSNALLLRY